MDSILLFGASGYLGGYLQDRYPGIVCPKRDIADRAFVEKALDDVRPSVVINAAGKTGRPNVDWCEDHKEETMRANVMGPLVLVEECLKRNIYFVHIGSGCIYSGVSPEGGFTEEMMPNFSGSFYSLTKFTTDILLQRFPVLNLRLRMPFDGTLSPRNLIIKLSKYQKVLDETNSLTYIPDFIDALDQLIHKRALGTFNIVSPTPLSPYQIMQAYTQIVDPTHTFERLTVATLNTVTKAERSNCILSGKKLADLGIVMRPAEEVLKEALHSIQKTQAKV
ncbi:MAG: NAD-dependent epimerase/dehydratase family protein [Candidatus Peribacteraceae bacterium]